MVAICKTEDVESFLPMMQKIGPIRERFFVAFSGEAFDLLLACAHEGETNTDTLGRVIDAGINSLGYLKATATKKAPK